MVSNVVGSASPGLELGTAAGEKATSAEIDFNWRTTCCYVTFWDENVGMIIGHMLSEMILSKENPFSLQILRTPSKLAKPQFRRPIDFFTSFPSIFLPERFPTTGSASVGSQLVSLKSDQAPVPNTNTTCSTIASTAIAAIARGNVVF